MGEDLLKKKVLIDKEPVFDHAQKGVEEAIGIKGIVESLGQKLAVMETKLPNSSPSKAVEYLYNNFSKIELAFFVMHMMSKEVTKDLTQPEQEA